MKKLKVAILISGRGSNLESLIKSTTKKNSLVDISLVISNNSKAKGLIIANKKNRKSFIKKLEELTIVNELSLTIGLVMLTIGNFLGGMWANESWGRYWGWDPKETWALISIIIYTAVLHLRIVPKLNNKWLFNLMSIISFGAIMMTYFGVNFYLVGLHSYASGDKVITPDFVYYSIGFIIILGLISYFANKKNQVL